MGEVKDTEQVTLKFTVYVYLKLGYVDNGVQRENNLQETKLKWCVCVCVCVCV